MNARALALGCALLWTTGCAASPLGPRSPAEGAPSDPVVEVDPIVVSPYSEAELAGQFERATAMLLADNPSGAAEVFDRIVRIAPASPLVPAALFNSGLSHQAMGDQEMALARFREVLARFGDHPAARSAILRLSRALSYLERWDELLRVSDQILARTDLVLLERIEALGSKALGLLEGSARDVDAAAREVGRARDLIEDARLGEAGAPPVELAQVSFALGEVRRVKSERIVFEPLPKDFTASLEERCQGLLDAQSAYSEAMRSKDAHWSAMAGYRVGQLYQTLHRDVLRITAPPSADTPERKQLFEAAMRLRYRILIEKGLKMMDATVRLGERTGEASPWIARAKDAKRELEGSLEEEKTALAKLPFTEEEIEKGLSSLKKP